MVADVSRIQKYLYLVVGLWTICFIAVWFLIYGNWKEEFHKHVSIEAQTVLNKDVSFRTWATMHGGVYIPPTEKTPPNPYLDFLPDRDVVTTDGKNLTLMNPAYMIRQVMQEYEGTYGIKGHITSLKLINPANAPDEWEISVLKGFETDWDSVDIFVQSDGEMVYRKMIPLITKQGCLKCHARQGYKVGDIRGGLSVTLPVTQLYALGKNNIIKETIILTGIFILGLIGLLVTTRKNIKDRKELAAYAESLKRYEEIVSSTQDLMSFVDTDYRYVAISDTYTKLYNKPRDEIVGHHVEEVLSKEGFNAIKEYLDKSLQGEAVTFERWLDVPPLKKRFFHITYSPYRNEEGVISGVVGNIRDITESKEAEEKIQNSLKEKEVLLKEIHHRVKNNMAVISSLLALQSGYIDEKKYLDMFKESQSRIHSMALVHEKLYQSEDFAHINIRDYIETLTQSIKETFFGNREVTTKLDVDDINLDIDVLIPCGLIINEILTNAFKHAFNGHENPGISLSIKKDDDEDIALTISDNGKGFPEGFDMSKTTGLGLKLVSILVNQINGKLEVKSENGVTFTITFPSTIEHARHLPNNG